MDAGEPLPPDAEARGGGGRRRRGRRSMRSGTPARALLIAEGRNIVQVSRWLGHHSPSFTLDVYAHLMDEGVGAPLADCSGGVSLVDRDRERIELRAPYRCAQVRPGGPIHAAYQWYEYVFREHDLDAASPLTDPALRRRTRRGVVRRQPIPVLWCVRLIATMHSFEALLGIEPTHRVSRAAFPTRRSTSSRRNVVDAIEPPRALWMGKPPRAQSLPDRGDLGDSRRNEAPAATSWPRRRRAAAWGS